LKLPTFLHEFEKVARECAREGVDHPRYRSSSPSGSWTHAAQPWREAADTRQPHPASHDRSGG
jgi:hypothetical protein